MSRTKIGKYINLERIGAGGMAEVFIGDDPSLDRKVAIKLILPHLATAGGFEERFRREAKTVAALRHTNIIQIYEYAIEDGNPYMVMEYLANGALEERLTDLRSRDEIMPIEEAVDLLDKIASGLDYAHKRDLIHRDIKPSNILLSADGEPIIADFGIVKMLNESVVLTQTGGVVGSPRYLPPEQASNAPVDHRSDIYSLGIMFYEMVTGEVPFDGDLISIMMQHVNESPRNPSELNPSLPWGASSVIMQALSKDPDDRFQTAGEMAKTFKKALATGEAAIAAAAAAPPETVVSTHAPTFIEKPENIDKGIMAGAPTPVSATHAPTFIEKPENIDGGTAAPAATHAPTFIEKPEDIDKGSVPAAPTPPQPVAAHTLVDNKPKKSGLPKGVLYGGVALVVLALVYGGISFFDGNGDTDVIVADSNSTQLTVEAVLAATNAATENGDAAPVATDVVAESTTEAVTLAPTEPPLPTPTATAFPEPWVQITDITIENGSYVIAYETFGYTPALSNDHVHFFYNNILLLNAGSPGNGPWKLYGGPSPFTEYAVSSRPKDATKICALFANADHSVEQNTGNCFNLSGKSTSEGFSLAGDWTFAMYAVGSNSAYDQGTLSFSDHETGTYHLIDFYDFEYDGTFIITATGFEIPMKGWIGHFEDANKISGTWDNGDAIGSFIATRK